MHPEFLIGGIFLLYIPIVFHRYLVNDDYQILYTSWLFSIGAQPGIDFYLTSFHFITIPLAFLLRFFHEGLFFVIIIRFFFLGVICASIYYVYQISRHLFNRSSATAASLFVLSSSAFINRGLDIRPDMITALTWLMILHAYINKKKKDKWIIGLLCGFALVNRFKAGLILPLVFMFELRYFPIDKCLQEKKTYIMQTIKTLLQIGFYTAIPVLFYLSYIYYSNQWGAFVESHMDIQNYVTHFSSSSSQIRSITFVQFVKEDWLFLTFFFISIFYWRTLSKDLFFLLMLLTLAIGSVFLNTAYYPYNLVVLVVLIAPFAGAGISQVLEFLKRPLGDKNSKVLFMVACLLIPLMKSTSFIKTGTHNTIKHQIQLQNFIDSCLPKEASVFAFEGIGLFRKSTFHWRSSSFMLPTYRAKGMKLEEELKHDFPSIIIANYRIPAWLNLQESKFISDNYLPLCPFILIPGKKISAGIHRSVLFLESGNYRIIKGKNTGKVIIDDREYFQNETIQIKHPITITVSSGTCYIIKNYSEQCLNLLENPYKLPYLFSPGIQSL